MDESEWKKSAANLLKSELARAGIGYPELSQRLVALGIDEPLQGVAAKINRGAFSFVFFMQCMEALGKTKIRL